MLNKLTTNFPVQGCAKKFMHARAHLNLPALFLPTDLGSQFTANQP